MAPSSPSRGHRQPSCDCDKASTLLFDEIEKASAPIVASPAPQTPPATPLALDGALLLGRRLALQWEPMNQCVHVGDHLDAANLLSMAHSIECMLRLYEVLLANTLDPHTGSRVGGAVHQSPLPQTTTTAPIFLGSLQLHDEEAQVVSQQALRHIIARLGEILKDIEEDAKQLVDQRQEGGQHLSGDVRKAQDLMFRLLGRVPRL